MSGSYEATRQANWIVAPTSGNVTVANASATQQTVNVTSWAANYTYITVQADGAKAYVMFSANAALANTVNATAPTGTTSAILIPDQQEREFKLTPKDQFMGLVASGTCQVRLWQSGPPRRN